MGRLIAAVQRKGGCGKTTTVVNLAADLARRGHTVFVVDADPQASAAAWAEPRKLPFTVVKKPIDPDDVKGWVAAIRGLVATVDYVLIDAPPHVDAAVGAALAISDLALLPCGPSDLDLAGLRQTLDLVHAVRRSKKLKVILVPVRVDFRTVEGQDLSDELRKLKEPVAPKLGDFTAFKRSFSLGQSVHDFEPQSRATQDVVELGEFVLRTLQGATGKRLLLTAPSSS
ncbi:MAG: ParA family protein [Alsobacter sp.]